MLNTEVLKTPKQPSVFPKKLLGRSSGKKKIEKRTFTCRKHLRMHHKCHIREASDQSAKVINISGLVTPYKDFILLS